VVQDAWVAVITGIAGFSGQAPLRAWLSGIVVNKARTRAVRDGRSISFEDLGGGPAVDPSRFGADGHWLERFGPCDWLTPERIAGDRQLLDRILALLDTLPEAQRAVILLRDVEGLEPVQICAELGIGEGNFRVLLHRARAKLRDAAPPC
jgi:RNA polymerase sigma-70 factor (ECF subfamily)